MYNKGNRPTGIREDEYYYEWMEDILEAFPNKGPPYTPTKLCSYIYIGSLVNAEDYNLLKRLGITHVLNCAGTRRFDLDKSPYPSDVGVREYRMIPAEDFEDYNIARHFNTAFSFLERCKRQGGKCLVHCNLGVNRSGAVCAGYLMMNEKRTLLQVAEHLKKARQVVLTNRGFRYQLINYARMRNLLDPIIEATGFPSTIPPPTGLSKFSRHARKEAKSKTRKGTSKVPPASDFLRGEQSSSSSSSAASDGARPRPKSATGMITDPPVSSKSFTRSSSAMGVHNRHLRPKHKSFSWSDNDLEEYMENDGRALEDGDYDDDGEPTMYETSSFTRSSLLKSGRAGGSSYKGSGLTEGLSYDYGASSSRRSKPVYTRSISLGASESVSPFQRPRNLLNLINQSRAISSNGLGAAANGYASASTKDQSYNTLTIPSNVTGGGLSFNVPKPPFGTSRRRFGPSKVVGSNY